MKFVGIVESLKDRFSSRRASVRPTRAEEAPPPLYEPLDPTRHQIRLLSFESTPGSDTIHCSLRVVDLSESPVYTALSYEWGPADDSTHTIYVNNYKVAIRRNLFDFFMLNKHRYKSRLLWVDQLCIDQSQTDEKNHQVGMMELIYRGAKRTLCWLGHDPNDGLAFSAIATLFKEQEILARWQSDSWGGISMAERSAFVTMTALSYWTRHWIVQELLLSTNALLIYGSRAIAFAKLNQDSWGYSKWIEVPSPNHALRDIVMVAQSRAQPKPVNPFVLLVQLGDISRSTTCLDLRDKIYGIQSLLPTEFQVQIDYDEALDDVFVRAISHWFRNINISVDAKQYSWAVALFAYAMGFEKGSVPLLIRDSMARSANESVHANQVAFNRDLLVYFEVHKDEFL